MLKIKIILASLGLATASAAAAQDAEFARFVAQANAANPAPTAAEIMPVALEVLRANPRAGDGCVPTGLSIDTPRPVTASRHIVQLIRAGEVRNGWTVYARTEGCGETRPLRMVVIRPASGPLLAVALLHGEGIANPTLVIDTRDAARTAAGAMAGRLIPGCVSGGIALDSVRTVSQSEDLGPDFYGARYRGSWREAWTFVACGRRIELPITFTADGESGANYSIHASEARLLD
jgi:hypothetical protein